MIFCLKINRFEKVLPTVLFLHMLLAFVREKRRVHLLGIVSGFVSATGRTC